MTKLTDDDFDDDDNIDEAKGPKGPNYTHREDLETEVNDCNETIGLFGIAGNTGQHLVKLLLDAGYSVKALLSATDKVEVEHDQLELVVGGLDDVEKLEEVIAGASHSICLLGECYSKKDYKDRSIYEFIKRIYPIMKENNTQVFIYQASAISVDAQGNLPLLSKIVKITVGFLTNTALQQDHDAIIKYIGDNTGDWFRYIITRPGPTRDGPSKKTLSASKSQPGPVPIMNIDLAEFTLQAMKSEKLYNKCPYVVW